MKDPEQVMSSPSRIPRPVGAPLMVIMAQRNRSNHEFSALNTAEGTNASPVPRVIQPTQLPPISERNSTETDHEIAIPLSSEVPTLHIASSAERIIMGDEASSIPLLSRQHEFRSQGVFYPRTMQNTSPVSDVSASTVRGEETTTSPRRRVHAHLPPERRPSPTKSIHTSPRSSTDNSSPGCSNCESPHARSIPAVRRTTVDNAMSGSAKTLPPRTSSLNVFSHSAHKPLRPSKSFQNPHANAMMGQSQTMNFLDICRSHPELEGTVIQTNIVKAPEPRMTRVMGNLRHAFTRGRTDKRSVSSMFEIVNQRPPIPRPVVPPPPVAASETKSSLTTTAGSDACPSNRSGQIRQVETPGVDSVCRTLNAVGLRLVEDDDIERRRLWYREFVQLFNLLADFNSRDTRIGEAASHVSQMRAEASLRRYAMLLQVHQVIHDHDDLEALIESADFPTDRIVEEWHS